MYSAQHLLVHQLWYDNPVVFEKYTIVYGDFISIAPVLSDVDRSFILLLGTPCNDSYFQLL